MIYILYQDLSAFIQHKALNSCNSKSSNNTTSTISTTTTSSTTDLAKKIHENEDYSSSEHQKSANSAEPRTESAPEPYAALGSPSISGSGQTEEEEGCGGGGGDARRHLFADAETNTVSSSGI